jgi:hypothetical protein
MAFNHKITFTAQTQCKERVEPSFNIDFRELTICKPDNSFITAKVDDYQIFSRRLSEFVSTRLILRFWQQQF